MTIHNPQIIHKIIPKSKNINNKIYKSFKKNLKKTTKPHLSVARRCAPLPSRRPGPLPPGRHGHIHHRCSLRLPWPCVPPLPQPRAPPLPHPPPSLPSTRSSYRPPSHVPPPPGEGKGRSGAEGRRAACGVEEDITQEVEAAPIVVIRTRWGGMAERLLRIFFCPGCYEKTG